MKTFNEIINEIKYDISKAKPGDITPGGSIVQSQLLFINRNGTIELSELKPSEQSSLGKNLRKAGFNVLRDKYTTGLYYQTVLVEYKLPFNHGKFAKIFEESTGIILLSTNGKRISKTNKF